MSPAELRARVAETRSRQRKGPTIADPDTLRQLAARVYPVLVRQKGGADDDNGGGPTASRRRPSKAPSSKTRPAAGTGEGADGTS